MFVHSLCHKHIVYFENFDLCNFIVIKSFIKLTKVCKIQSSVILRLYSFPTIQSFFPHYISPFLDKINLEISTFTLDSSEKPKPHPRHTPTNSNFTACKGQFVYLLRMKGFFYCVVNERKLNWNKNRMKTKLNVHVFIGFSLRNRLSLVSMENMLNNTLFCACVSFSCDWFYTNVNFFYRFWGRELL